MELGLEAGSSYEHLVMLPPTHKRQMQDLSVLLHHCNQGRIQSISSFPAG